MDFNKEFNKATVLDFLKNQFLPDDFKVSPEQVKFTPDRIKEIEYIGESKNLDLKLFVVRHDSENDPRVTLSRETFRVMSSLGARRALIVFHSSASPNWRLSLATIELSLKGAKTKREYSNPRRYSFFLGPEAKNHTPEQFLSKKVTDFEDLLGRFSIEVVNKDFYNEIATKFTALVGGKRKVKTKVVDFDKPALRLPGLDMSKPASHITAQEFAVRLIGRIVFCWFLKKKKSPGGEPLLPESVLSSAAVAACDRAGDSYYHTVLENFFFQVLNTEMVERGKEFKKTPYDKIPFLNGGLFEPHDGDFYDFDVLTGCSRLSSTLKIPNDWFKSFIETLETYNFTIDENTSVDVELAVDPEMLGRIFENLLAEINPETGETARKATGSYYTPRPIVEYMVDESLKEYLKTKTAIAENKLAALLSYAESDTDLSEPEKEKVISALDEVKIIDPACGSGAFPMGMLQKIVLILQKVDPDSKKWLSKLLDSVPDSTAREMLRKKLEDDPDLWNYTHKLGIIRKSIYGVDIQPIAVEISKLRFFLSLVVDEKVTDKGDRGIIPLPNLEFKFVCANSLIGLPEVKEHQATLFDKTTTNGTEDDIKELKSIRDEFFSSYGAKKKRLEKKFEVVRGRLYDAAIKSVNTSQTLALGTWKPFENTTTGWFDPDWMFGIKNGFDIVIANPPYGAEFSEDDKTYLKRRFDHIAERIRNSFLYFMGLGYDIATNDGVVCFILPNEFLFQIYMTKARKFFLDKSQFLFAINTGEDVFKAIVPTCVVAVKKTTPVGLYPIPVSDLRECSLEELPIKLNTKSFAKSSNTTILKTPNFMFSFDGKRTALVVKLSAEFPKLETFCSDIANGISTSYDEIYIVSDEVVKEKALEKAYLKPCIRGGQFNRYLCPGTTGENVLYVTHDFSPEKSPRILKYLEAHKKTLVAKCVEKKSGTREWHVLFRSRYQGLFVAPKILIRQTGDGIIASIDAETGYYCIDSVNIATFTKPNLKYLKYFLALLNSKLLNFFYREISQEKGRILAQVKPQRIKALPVPGPSNSQEPVITTLVDKIIALKSKSPEADTSELEAQIDQLVYKLYNLTPPEIVIVEGELE